MVRLGIHSLLLWGLILLSGVALAAPASLTYQGRIIQADGKPLQNSSVSFLFEITNTAGTCILYREQVNGINMVNSGGVFDVKIGASHTYPSSPTFTILDSFNNSTPLVCDGGVAFNPTATDGRLLRVQFYDGSAWRVITPDSVIRSVPYAAYSESALKLGSNYAQDFILKNTVNNNTSCDGGSFLTWNASTQSFGCAAGSGGGGGAGTVTDITSANPYLSIADGTSVPILTINVGQIANTVAAGNDPRFTNSRAPNGNATGDLSGQYPNPNVARLQGVGIDFSNAPATGEVLTFDGANWVSSALPAGNTGTVTSVATGTGLTGGTITGSGTIGLGAALLGFNNIATNGYIQRTGAGTYSTTAGGSAAATNNLVLRDGSGVSSFYGVGIHAGSSGEIFLQAPSIATTYSMTLPDQQGAANQVMVNDGSGILSWSNMPTAPGSACTTGNVLSYNGSAFVCVPDQIGSAGGGIASLGGQTGSSQSFANGTAGNSPHWVSGSDQHTLNIPYARTASVTAGLISKTEYDSFNSKQAALGFTPLNPANNLSELAASAATARGNLGLGSASVKDAPSSGVNAATTEVVMGDDSRLTNSRAPSGNAGGDLALTYPNPEVARIKGISLAYTSLTSGHYLKYNGTSWINSAIATADIAGLSTALGNKIDQSQIVGTCSSASTLVFSSVSGNWTCTNIAISDSQITYGSKTANTFLAAPSGSAGAPSFRAIASADLPASVTDGLWTAGSGNVYRATGNVGVGNSSPQAKFVVNINSVSPAASTGTTMQIVGANATDSLLSMHGYGGVPALSFRSAKGTGASPTAMLLNNELGNIHFVGYGATGYLTSSAAKISSYATENWTDATGAGDLRFYTRPSGSTGVSQERMRIDPDGQVGIGAAPDSLFHAYKASGFANAKVQSANSGASQQIDRPAGQFGYVRTSTGNVARWDFGATNEAESGSNVGSNFYIKRFSDAGSSLGHSFTILRNSGFVGVNTETPLTGFNVVGTGGSNDDVALDSYTSSGEAALFFRKAYGTEASPTAVTNTTASLGKISWRGHDGSAYQDVASIQVYSKSGTATNNDSLMVFRTASGTGSGTEAMRINEAGKVGIDTSTPGSTLSVSHAGASSWRVAIGGLGTTTGTYGLVVRDSANTNTFWVRDDGAIHAASRIGIAVAPDTNYALRMAGNLYVGGSAGNCILGNATGGVSCTSDARLKDNVISIPDSLEKILQVRGVEYDWNKASGHEGQHAMGVIAQEVEKVFPELVHKDPSSGYRTVDYGGLVAPLIEAFKDLYAHLVSTDERVAKVESENKQLKTQLENQSRDIASIKEDMEEQRALNKKLLQHLEQLQKQNSKK